MAILTKASTVRNRTSKVNKFDLYLTEVAANISRTADHGDFETEVYVPAEFKDQLFAALVEAGYDTKPYYSHMWECGPCCTPDPPGVIRKLINMINPPEPGPCPVLEPVVQEDAIIISWAKPRDTTQPGPPPGV